MKSTKIKTYTTKDGALRVGIISDTQLPPTPKKLEESDVFCKNLRNALNVLKDLKADMILFAGDIGDLGTRFAFQTYVDIINEVYGDDKPIIQTIMGNHDYWSKDLFTWRPHKKAFVETVGHSPWTHYVVNGIHFIGASPNSGNMTNGYLSTLDWLESEIVKAEQDAPDKPIFVMTHNQPKDTSYGAEDWGDKSLGKIFEKHPNVINFSGHVHYSLLDERSIWQGGYTVINTQSLSYTELEPGKENGTIPPNADKTPMGYLMEFEDDKFYLRRLNFANGKEEKQGECWTFPLPYKNDKRYSFEKRKKENKPPTAENIKYDVAVKDGHTVLTFDAAQDDDFVHSYKVVVDSQKPKLFFSDFYNGLEDMSKTVTIELKKLSDPKGHSIEVYAIDSWGEETLCFKTTK